MKTLIILAALALLFCVPSFPQQQPTLTARQYFVELRDANAFNKYADKYVCFPDTENPGFVVVSDKADVVDRMARSGNEKGVKLAVKTGDGLFVRTFYKGVETGGVLFYDKIEDSYRLEFKSPLHGRAVYLINWKTGRYRFQVYDLDKSKVLPSEEISGKCELIRPDDTPSIAGEKP
ncbi:MAG TPA: hypothetical protein VN884_04475 [Candidatus Sulfotelmatobacter sp.]|nr:hypothetical protein [Candidatus Sulfotelmatobacter sp.]